MAADEMVTPSHRQFPSVQECGGLGSAMLHSLQVAQTDTGKALGERSLELHLTRVDPQSTWSRPGLTMPAS